MITVRSAFSAATTFAATVYWGWLFYYFFSQAGSIEEAQAEGLGATLLGIAVVGTLFGIAFLVQIVRILRKLYAPPSGPTGGSRSLNTEADGDGEVNGEADALIKRYAAARATSAAAVPPANGKGAGKPGATTSFGRRNK